MAGGQSRLGGTRSASQPAAGDATDSASGTAVIMAPSAPGPSPFTCDRKNGFRKAAVKSAA